MGYTHGKQWDFDKIKEKILEVVENLELDRMPSRSEVEAYYKDTSLTNAVSRRYGWYELAGMLELKEKQSATYFGKRHEQLVLEKLSSLGYEVRRMPTRFPYDLLVNDGIKIDVKVSRLYRGKMGNFYTFNLEKPFITCDLFALLTVNSDNEIDQFYLVPSIFVFQNSQISIGEHKSKYEIFKERWDLLELYDVFLNKTLKAQAENKKSA